MAQRFRTTTLLLSGRDVLDVFYPLNSNPSGYLPPTSGSNIQGQINTINSWTGTRATLYSKSISIDSPVSGDNITLFKTDEAIITNKMWAVLRGSSPTLTYTVKFDTGRHTNGIELVTNGIATSSITSGDLTTSFNNSLISGDCWVWLEITATGGNSLSGFHNTIFYTYQ